MRVLGMSSSISYGENLNRRIKKHNLSTFFHEYHVICYGVKIKNI